MSPDIVDIQLEEEFFYSLLAVIQEDTTVSDLVKKLADGENVGFFGIPFLAGVLTVRVHCRTPCNINRSKAIELTDRAYKRWVASRHSI